MIALSSDKILAINAIEGILAVKGMKFSSIVRGLDLNNLTRSEKCEVENRLFSVLENATTNLDLQLVQLVLSAGCRLSNQSLIVSALHLSFLRICHSNESVTKLSEMLSILVSSGFDINCKENGRHTLLHIACLLPLPDVVKILIAHKAKVDVLASQNRTPLMFAVLASNSFKSVQLLLEQGADPWRRDSNLHNAFDLARINRSTSTDLIVELINSIPEPRRNIWYYLVLSKNWLRLRSVECFQGVSKWIRALLYALLGH